jgi:two-component system, chemotaxis family, chemotaxis protein CheY
MKENILPEGTMINGNKHILLVDDDVSIQKLFAKFLNLFIEKAVVYELSLAENGLDALAILTTDRTIDIILTDIEMPKMNGFDFVKTVRSNPRFANIPILVHAAADNEARDYILDLGANSFLSKPAEVSTIMQHIKEFLEPTEITSPVSA